MAERQLHGFTYQQYIYNTYNVEEEKKYTHKWDGYYKGKPVSIKNPREGGDIEMADFFRQMETKEDFYLIVGFHDKNNVDIITKEYFLLVNGEEYHSFFNEEIGFSLKHVFDGITNDKKDDIKWKETREKYKNLWKNETKNIIRPRFKRDHKKQKRIQCAINNKDFEKYFILKYDIGDTLERKRNN